MLSSSATGRVDLTQTKQQEENCPLADSKTCLKGQISLTKLKPCQTKSGMEKRVSSDEASIPLTNLRGSKETEQKITLDPNSGKRLEPKVRWLKRPETSTSGRGSTRSSASSSLRKRSQKVKERSLLRPKMVESKRKLRNITGLFTTERKAQAEARDKHWMVTKMHGVFRAMNRNALRLVLLGLGGIFVFILQRELEWQGLTTSGTATRFLNMIVTVGLLIEIHTYYVLRHRLAKIKLRLLAKTPFYITENLKYFILEVIVCSLCDVPFCNYSISSTIRVTTSTEVLETSVKNAFSLFIFSRLYLIIRFITVRWYSPGLKIFGSWLGVNFNTNFTLREMFHLNPAVALGSLFASALLCLSYCIFVVERDANPGMHSYTSALYFTMITGYSVGYGDIYPVTSIGRVISVVTVICFTVINALLVATLVDRLQFERREQKMSQYVQVIDLERRTKHVAATLLQTAWRLRRAETGVSPWQSIQALCYTLKFVRTGQEFQRLRKALTFQAKYENPEDEAQLVTLTRLLGRLAASEIARKQKSGKRLTRSNPELSSAEDLTSSEYLGRRVNIRRSMSERQSTSFKSWHGAAQHRELDRQYKIAIHTASRRGSVQTTVETLRSVSRDRKSSSMRNRKKLPPSGNGSGGLRVSFSDKAASRRGNFRQGHRSAGKLSSDEALTSLPRGLSPSQSKPRPVSTPDTDPKLDTELKDMGVAVKIELKDMGAI